MAIFAQPTQDVNLIPGWDVQGNGTAGDAGPDDPGYAQAGNTGTVYGPGQAGSGLPNPPQAENVGGENSASYGLPILGNPGYADGTGPGGRALGTGSFPNAPAVPATGVVATNPTNLVATVVIAANGATITAVKTGSTGQTYAQATQAGTAAGTYIVPPGGVIGIAYTVATPTWTWSV